MNKYLTKKIKSAFLATTILAESMLSTVSLAADPPEKYSTGSDQATTPTASLFRMPTKRAKTMLPAKTAVESSKKETAAIIQEKATPSSTIPYVYSVDEQALIAKLNHIRHTLKKEAFVDFCENIHKEMNQHRSSYFNKWCLSTLIKILELQPESTQIKNKIIEAYNSCKKWSCFDKDDFSDPTLLYRALAFSKNVKSTDFIIEEIINKYIKKLMTDSEFQNLNFESYPSYYKLDMIRCLSLCSKFKKLNQDEIKKHYSQIDISKIQKEPAKIYRKALLCFGQIPHNATNQLAALHALVGSSPEQFAAAAKGDKISRGALLQLGKIPDNPNRLAALHALVGSSPEQFAATAKNGDEISRDAFLQLGKIPHNPHELAALYTLVGSSEKDFTNAANGDEISRGALLQLGKIPLGKTPKDKIAQAEPLYALVGSSPKQFAAAAKNGDDISRDALLQLGKIPHNTTNQLAALHALIGSYEDHFQDSKVKDDIYRDALLALGKIPHNSDEQLTALHVLVMNIQRKPYDKNPWSEEFDYTDEYLISIKRECGKFGTEILRTLRNIFRHSKDKDYRQTANYIEKILPKR